MKTLSSFLLFAILIFFGIGFLLDRVDPLWLLGFGILLAWVASQWEDR